MNVPVHTDAVQAVGSLPLDVRALGMDAISLSGHKLGAPKGTGVLYLRGRVQAEPLLHGGGQERGRRSGTENLAAAIGFALALNLATKAHPEQTAVRFTLSDATTEDQVETTIRAVREASAAVLAMAR